MRVLLALALVLVGVLACLITWWLRPDRPAADPFKVHIASTRLISPGTLVVTIQVTNTGKSPAAPTCTVNVSGASGAYTGANETTFSGLVSPGRTGTSVVQVPVSHQGARYISSVRVTC